jgi:general stress protein YciG
MATDPQRSASTRKDGGHCQAPALPKRPYCFAHDPERAEARAEARRRGGEHSAKIVRLRGLVPPRLLPVYDRLEGALAEVHDGTLDPRQASAMAALARAMTTVLTAGELSWSNGFATWRRQRSNRSIGGRHEE